MQQAPSPGEELLVLHMRAYNLPAPVRERRFHPDRNWCFDFCWPWTNPPLAVEIQGGTHTGKGHAGGKGYRNDCAKLNAAQLMGWTVLQYTTEMVEDATAIDELRKIFRRKP